MIIAVFGFIAPTVTILLPILEKRIASISSILLIQETTLQNIQKDLESKYLDSFAEIKDEKLRERLIKEANKYNSRTLKKFNRNFENKKKQLAYLNLRIQIVKIFGLLLLALLFVMIYHLVKVNLYGVFGLTYTHRLLLGLFSLSLSGITFYASLLILWRIFCVMLLDSADKESELPQNNIGIQNGNTND